MPNVIDLRHGIQYYGKSGITLGYKNEDELFKDYEKIIIPSLKNAKKELFFGTWRGKLVNGGLMKHPGLIKLNGLEANSREEVNSITSLVAKICKNEKVMSLLLIF